MPLSNKPGQCLICTKHTTAIHMHHTVPRSMGGEDSLQIPLCGDCHTILHAHANGIVSNVRGKKKVHKNYWQTERQSSNASPFLEILVRAILNPPEHLEKQWLLPMLRVPASLRQSIQLLKQDIGTKSLETTLMFCIQYTLYNRGLIQDGTTKEKNNSSAASKMWGV